MSKLKSHFSIFLIFSLLVFSLVGCNPKESSDTAPASSGVVQIDKGSLYYQTFGQGKPIIVLHGGPGLDQGYLLPQMKELAQNHQVIFYDQRGSGKSTTQAYDAQTLNMKQFVADLEALRESLEVENFVLVGHSFGGYLAMEYATSHGDNLAGLILLNSAPADFKGQKAFMDNFIEKTQDLETSVEALFELEAFKKLSAKEIGELHKELFSVYFHDSKDVEQLSLEFEQEAALGGFKVSDMMRQTSWMQEDLDLMERLKDVNVPTLVVHGNQDIIPAWTAADLHKAIKGSEILYMDECGHFPYIEQPGILFAALESFMADKAAQ